MLRKGLSNHFREQKFSHLLAIDFEATCLSGNRLIDPQEIIEFPCLKVETKGFNVVDQFHSYVKPKFHPILSEFCTELTGIMQETVQAQPEFPIVFKMFQDWLSANNDMGNDFAFVTCGDWDLKVCLPNQCKASGLKLPEYCQRWVNIKKSHQMVHNKFPRSLNEMLVQNGLSFEGRPHSGIDDTQNLVRLIKALAVSGHVFDLNSP